jgi:LytS/YehU family sensor histidine kinase
LRYSLASDRRDTVPLGEELEIVDEYLNLERMRFEERLRVERTVDAPALTATIPPMIVQTLVENAVKHGIAGLKEGGVVRLDARLSHDRLHVTVTNSGRFKPPSEAGGQGLKNAVERLRLLYGGTASLSVNGNEHSTVASLTVPVAAAHERAAG